MREFAIKKRLVLGEGYRRINVMQTAENGRFAAEAMERWWKFERANGPKEIPMEQFREFRYSRVGRSFKRRL